MYVLLLQHQQELRPVHLVRYAADLGLLQPGNKICGNRDYVSPGWLMAHWREGSGAESAVLGRLDAILDPGMARCRASKNANWPTRVLVANA